MKYPLVKQGGYKNCGPCSLASIIRYYKGYVSVDTLEDMMHQTLNGVSAYNIVETAKKIGFESYGMKCDSIENIHLPAIAYVTIAGGLNHFIVVYKVSNKVLIADPASKLKYISKEEFYKIWNNIVIILKPLKSLPNLKTKGLSYYIKDVIKNYKYEIIGLLIISLSSVYISFLYSLYIKNIINNLQMLINSYMPFIILFFINYIFIYYKERYQIILSKKIDVTLTNTANGSLITLPYMYYKNHRIGEVISRYQDISSVTNYITSLISLTKGIPILIVFLLFIYFESVLLFRHIIIIIFIYLIYNIFNLHYFKEDIKCLKREEAVYNSLFNETLNAFETIKGINIEDNMINKINEGNKKYKNTLCKMREKYTTREIISNVIFNIGSIYILINGFICYQKNLLGLGSLIAIYILYTNLEEALSIFTNVLVLRKEAREAARRIQELFFKFTSQQIENGNIEYKNLNYSIGYKKILEDINLKINKGDKVLIKGTNGSGKSTLMKILKGYINVDGIYVGGIPIKNKVSNISYVGKGDILFEGTLYENLMCDSALEEALKICCVDNKNIYIEENGFNISSGEKAKIILARTVLKPFEILILDEILNEIDIKTERIILNNLFEKFKDKTIIVISHRFNNIDLFNRIIEIENGKIKKGE